MKIHMLVLMNHLGRAEDWLSQVREFALTHGIAKVCPARVTPSCRWASECLTARHVEFVCPHLFETMRPTRQEQASE